MSPLLAVSALAASAVSLGFAKGPYLQDVGEASFAVRVEVTPPGPVSLEVKPDNGPTQTIESKRADAIHTIRVGDLKPSTHYSYVVRFGKESARGAVATAPASDSSAPFTFLLYGDNRSDHAAHESVVRALLKAPGDFLVHTGDFVETGSSAADWQTFFEIEAPLLRDRVVFSAVGNHELHEGGADAYLRYFGSSTSPDEPARLYSTFRWGSARFFLLNAFDDWSKGDERMWLEHQLALSQKEAGLVWRFVVTHQAPWSSGPHSGNKRLLDAGIPALLAQNKVDLLFAGHDHIYERGEGAGLKYVISGGGGAPLYRIASQHPNMRKAEAAHHFVAFTVTKDKVSLSAQRLDGSVLENCGFAPGTSWDCDPVKAANPSPAKAPAPIAEPSRCGCSVPGASGDVSAALAVAFMLVGAVARRAGKSS